ncbi:hypothetical protein [Lederbergia citri]|uniref:Uncharacterized protein n=1 Tax=Lederbergia citri TaxID=2833580 RepID=A0A942YF40_9BACI|nr:hypothetical protein [Lederbergia citri]MBS4194598.1 hypothetical protein [Lederbergia citri]
MRTFTYWSISSFILAIIGFIFSMEFQSIAYWGPNRTLTMQWYWSGAVLSYVCSIAAISLMFYKIKSLELSKADIMLRSFGTVLIVISLFWTTFIIIAWQSGF